MAVHSRLRSFVAKGNDLYSVLEAIIVFDRQRGISLFMLFLLAVYYTWLRGSETAQYIIILSSIIQYSTYPFTRQSHVSLK